MYRKIIKPEDLTTIERSLLLAANYVKDFAYAPYSKEFHVGAAVLTVKDLKTFTGCNVEDAAFTGLHAEGVAIGKAVSEGYREFSLLAVIGGPKEGFVDDIITCCGGCLQRILEFSLLSGTYTDVIMSNMNMSKIMKRNIKVLLPYGFGPKCLKR